MKLQDVLFLLVVLGLLVMKKLSWSGRLGIFCLVAAFMLYQGQVLFTAQRLVMYAAGFFLLQILRINQLSNRVQ